eukprot:SAG31_NODE_88_length_26714_cov_6.972046_13_plen_96_part_00
MIDIFFSGSLTSSHPSLEIMFEFVEVTELPSRCSRPAAFYNSPRVLVESLSMLQHQIHRDAEHDKRGEEEYEESNLLRRRTVTELMHTDAVSNHL